jgi:hypothetical protein
MASQHLAHHTISPARGMLPLLKEALVHAMLEDARKAFT